MLGYRRVLVKRPVKFLLNTLAVLNIQLLSLVIKETFVNRMACSLLPDFRRFRVNSLGCNLLLDSISRNRISTGSTPHSFFFLNINV